MEKLNEIEEALPSTQFHKLVDNVAETEDIGQKRAVLYLMMNCTEWLDANTNVKKNWRRGGYTTVEDVTLRDDFEQIQTSTKNLILHFDSERNN